MKTPKLKTRKNQSYAEFQAENAEVFRWWNKETAVKKELRKLREERRKRLLDQV